MLLGIIILLIFTGCTNQLTIEERDDSGLLTMLDVTITGKNLCSKLLKIDYNLRHMMFGMAAGILKKTLPFPGPGALGPTIQKILSEIYDTILHIENAAIMKLEHKKIVSKPTNKVDDEDDHKKLEIGDAIKLGKLGCKFLRIWYDVITSPVGDALGLPYIRVPVRDRRHPLKWLKVLDFLNFESIPYRIEKYRQGKLGNFKTPPQSSGITGSVEDFFKHPGDSASGLFGGLFGESKQEEKPAETKEESAKTETKEEHGSLFPEFFG